MSRFDIDVVQRRLVFRLLKEESDALASSVAAMLRACKPGSPCSSGACFRCGERLQAAAVHLQPCTRGPRGRTSLITLVPRVGRAAIDDLRAEHYEAVRSAIEAALDEAGVATALFAIEASANEDETGVDEDHWRVHAHGHIPDWLDDDQELRLKRAIAGGTSKQRAVMVQKLDDRDEGAAYPYKPERFRRVSYLNTTNPNRAPCRDTRMRELRSWQSVMLAKAEHEFGLANRLVIRGIDQSAVEVALNGFKQVNEGP